MGKKGLVIAFLGTDGSGKSTLISELNLMVEKWGYEDVNVQHLRPNSIPPLSRLKGKKNVHIGPVTDPHGSTPSGFVGSFFRLNYLIFDYIFGYLIKVLPQVRRTRKLFVYDRYAYDILIDPLRFRIRLPSKLIRLYLRLVPEPDITFCLLAPPQTVWDRKKELPYHEVVRQVEQLRILSEEMKSAVIISTDSSIAQSMCEIEKYINQHG